MNDFEQLFNWSNFTLLKTFFNFDAPFSFTTLLEKSEMSRRSLDLAIKTLLQNELIEQRILGKAKLYYPNINPRYITIKKFYNYQTVFNLIKDLKQENQEVYLYGSYALGENNENSDIDILIIGNNDKIINEVNKKTKVLNKEVNIIFKNHIDYAKMEKDSPSFYNSINKTKVRLI